MVKSSGAGFLLFLACFSVMMSLPYEGRALAADVPPDSHEPRRDSQETAFAETVDGYKQGRAVDAKRSNPQNAVGLLDADGPNGYVSLGHADTNPSSVPNAPGFNPRTGCDSMLILEWHTSRIVDGPGVDIVVFEVGTNAGAPGLPEAMYVFVGDETDSWLYLGEFMVGQEAFDIDPLGDDPTLYKYVGLCDKVDGGSDQSNTGGPDIDAVAAVNWVPSSEPVLQVRAEGAKSRINDVLLKKSQSRIVVPGTMITSDDQDGFGLESGCSEEDAEKLAEKLIEIVRTGDEEVTVHVFSWSAFILAACGSRVTAEVAPSLLLELVEGGAQFQRSVNNFDLNLRTDVATACVEGEVSVHARHDSQQNESTFQAVGGPILITPTNSVLAPFMLPRDSTVTVTTDSVGDPVIPTQSYLPFIINAGPS